MLPNIFPSPLETRRLQEYKLIISLSVLNQLNMISIFILMIEGNSKRYEKTKIDVDY